MLSTRIAGIPCQVEMTSYTPYWNGRRGHIDNWLPDEPEQVEFEVYDRKGYPATWLANKMTDDDYHRIEQLLLEECNELSRT